VRLAAKRRLFSAAATPPADGPASGGLGIGPILP
jgi:hypothetical protein